MKRWTLLVSALIIGHGVHAAGPEYGSPTYGGSGCPGGSAEISSGLDGGSLKVDFEGYVAEADGNHKLDRKACSVAIPVRVPEGYSISIAPARLNGFALVPSGASAQLSVESFLAGGEGERTAREFGGGFTGRFRITSDLPEGPERWSECGQDTILRVNLSVIARAGDQDRRTLVIMDAALIHNLKIRRCS